MYMYKVRRVCHNPQKDDALRLCRRGYALEVLVCVILTAVLFMLMVADFKGKIDDKGPQAMIYLLVFPGMYGLVRLLGNRGNQGILFDGFNLKNELDWLTYAAENHYISSTMYLSALLEVHNAECLTFDGADGKNLRMEIRVRETGETKWIPLAGKIEYIEKFPQGMLEDALNTGANIEDIYVEMDLTGECPVFARIRPEC